MEGSGRLTEYLQASNDSWPGGCSAAAGRRAARMPYGVYLGSALFLALAGLAATAYLAVSHYRLYTDFEYQSFCALSRAINCDTVSLSPYAVLGRMPVAAWGFFGYALFLVLVMRAADRLGGGRRVWTLANGLAALLSLASLGYAFISTFLVGSYCLLCIATYAINLLLLFLTWVIRRRFGAEPWRVALRHDWRFVAGRRLSDAAPSVLVALAAVVTYAVYPAYWSWGVPPAAADLPSGLTEENHPWIGAENPTLVIVEFSDYQCFQCRKMHHHLRRLVAQHPQKLRLVHVHYPMDHEVNPVLTEPFHVGSGKMALLAIHAAAVGKFWEMNDRLFELGGRPGEIDLAELARSTGIELRELSAALLHPPYRQQLQRDIRRGIRLGARGTPSFLIDGELHSGVIPSHVLARLSHAEP